MPEAFVHNGYTVTLTEDYLFRVEEVGENAAYFERASDARNAIDERIKALKSQHRHSNKLALEAIAENGEHCVIRGINLNTKELLGPPHQDTYSRRIYPAYPPEPWIAAALKRLAMLKQECAVLDKRLRKFQVVRGADCYGRLDADKYDQAIAAFTARWTALCQEAAAEAPKEP